jgi:hypothetical protein
MESTRNSSDRYIPGSVWEARRRRWHRSERSRQEAFAELNLYVMAKGGGSAWIVSLPGDSLVVLEVLPTSDLPEDLRRRGYDVQPADPPEAGVRRPSWLRAALGLSGRPMPRYRGFCGTSFRSSAPECQGCSAGAIAIPG